MSTPVTGHGWHADDELLAGYTSGSLRAIEAASVEQHLVHCADCRAALRPHTDVVTLDQAWLSVRDRVERRPQPAAVRLARRLGLQEPTSVLLAATVTLRTAWLASAFIALGFAFVASRFSEGTTLWPFLLVAPLVPVLGVASAYGSSDDALDSLVATSPYGRTRLVLVRTIAVLVVALPFAALMGLSLPGPPWVAVAWLGPALMLVPILLALASFVGPAPASAVVALGWAGVVTMSVRHLTPTWPVESEVQLTMLALAALSGAVVRVRARTTRLIGGLW
jgi:hypothetical protein